MSLTVNEKRQIGRMLCRRYVGAHNIRFGADGAVIVTVDRMPNTNKGGRIFAGWDAELLREVAQHE